MNSEFRRSIVSSMEHLKRAIDEDYPDLMIAMAISRMHSLAIAHLGDVYTGELACKQIEMERQRHGLCPECGARIPEAQKAAGVYPPLCPDCVIELEDEAKEMDRAERFYFGGEA